MGPANHRLAALGPALQPLFQGAPGLGRFLLVQQLQRPLAKGAARPALQPLHRRAGGHPFFRCQPLGLVPGHLKPHGVKGLQQRQTQRQGGQPYLIHVQALDLVEGAQGLSQPLPAHLAVGMGHQRPGQGFHPGTAVPGGQPAGGLPGRRPGTGLHPSGIFAEPFHGRGQGGALGGQVLGTAAQPVQPGKGGLAYGQPRPPIDRQPGGQPGPSAPSSFSPIS